MQLLSHSVYGYNPAHEVDFYVITRIALKAIELDTLSILTSFEV